MNAHLDSTGAEIQSGGRPGYPAVTVDQNVDVQRHIKHAVVTMHTKGGFHCEGLIKTLLTDQNSERA